jgi:hypothetical protein
MIEYQPGDLVIWEHETRGGYGYVERIPAIVVRPSAQKVTIEVQTVDGRAKRVSVNPENVHYRAGQS